MSWHLTLVIRQFCTCAKKFSLSWISSFSEGYKRNVEVLIATWNPAQRPNFKCQLSWTFGSLRYIWNTTLQQTKKRKEHWGKWQRGAWEKLRGGENKAEKSNYDKAGFFNDPLGQTNNLARSEHCITWNLFCFAGFWKVGTDARTDRRTDNMSENNDHYRPWLWVGWWVDQYILQEY